MSINELTESLVKILEFENGIYIDLINVANDKTNYIVANDIEGLDTCTFREQQLIAKLKRSGELREKVFAMFSARLNVSMSDITVKFIISKIGTKTSSSLSTLYGQLINNASELKRLGNLNLKLLNNASEYVDFSINVMTGSSVQNNNYSNKGYSSYSHNNNKRHFVAAT